MKKGNNKILLTGAAGFIGSYIAKELLANDEIVIGIDNLNDYYNPELKFNRLENLKKNIKINLIGYLMKFICNSSKLTQICKTYNNIIIHMAAQAGVRYSLENPSAYIQSNLVGFGNILEICGI